MATQHHVGVDDRRQQSVEDLIRQFDPTKRPKETKPAPSRGISTPMMLLVTSVIAVSVAYFTAAFFLHDYASCHNIWREHIAEFGSFTSQSVLDRCASTIQWIDWCETQSYCKPLVRIIEWL